MARIPINHARASIGEKGDLMLVKNIRIYLVIVLLLPGLQVFAASTSLAPIGKRVYVLDEQEKTGPTSIQAESQRPKSAAYMKDPAAPGGPIHLTQKATPSAPKAKPLLAKAAVLTLKKQKIVGNYSYPRVGFASDKPVVQRVDEPLGKDFLERIFDDAERDL
jgi:hypothetical protein